VKLQQLRFVREVARHGMNVSQAAVSLHTSQPGVSKQIRALEAELGVQIFSRNGKHLSGLTVEGEAILAHAEQAISATQRIHSLAQEFRDETRGSLGIATTHTQARYALPRVIGDFIARYPDISLHMHQGTPAQIAETAARGNAEFAIATEALELYEDLVMLPAYQWNRSILIEKTHPLAEESSLTLENIAKYPIVTYTFGFTGRSRLDEAFRACSLEPRVVFTAADADVIKTYVRLGLGIGIVAAMAHSPDQDADLVALDASHLFEPSITRIGFRHDVLLRGFMLDFIEMFAPHLSRERVAQAQKAGDQREVDAMFADIELPLQQ